MGALANDLPCFPYYRPIVRWISDHAVKPLVTVGLPPQTASNAELICFLQCLFQQAVEQIVDFTVLHYNAELRCRVWRSSLTVYGVIWLRFCLRYRQARPHPPARGHWLHMTRTWPPGGQFTYLLWSVNRLWPNTWPVRLLTEIRIKVTSHKHQTLSTQWFIHLSQMVLSSDVICEEKSDLHSQTTPWVPSHPILHPRTGWLPLRPHSAVVWLAAGRLILF